MTEEEIHDLTERVKTIRNLSCSSLIVLASDDENKFVYLPSLLEQILCEAQDVVDNFCVVK